MNRNFILAAFLALTASCSQKENAPDYTKMSDEERLKAAIEIAQSTIMVDGHVDLPYRMKVGGFTLQREILDVSVRTPDGNFDYPRSKDGGLDAPFMSIYIPASYERTGGGYQLANQLIDSMEALVGRAPDKFAMAYRSDDLAVQFKQGKISLALGMENGTPINGKIENLRHFYRVF